MRLALVGHGLEFVQRLGEQGPPAAHFVGGGHEKGRIRRGAQQIVGFLHGFVVVSRDKIGPAVVRDDLDRCPVLVHLLDQGEKPLARFGRRDRHGAPPVCSLVLYHGTTIIVQRCGTTPKRRAVSRGLACAEAPTFALVSLSLPAGPRPRCPKVPGRLVPTSVPTELLVVEGSCL